MNSLVILDVPTSGKIPESLVGCPPNEVVVSTHRVRAVLGHVSDALMHLDENPSVTPDLIVVSENPGPSFERDDHHWGHGWRVGRDLTKDWINVAVEEGRVNSATWYELGRNRINVTRLPTCKNEGIVDFRLDQLLASASTEILVVRRDGSAQPRLRDSDPPETERLIRLWHGSPVQGLQWLSPSTGGRLWVSTSPAFAVSFAASPYSNHGFFHGVDRVSTDVPQVYLAVPHDRESVLDRPASLYQVEAQLSDLRPEGVGGYEFILQSAVRVVSEERCSTVAEALAAYGVETIRLGADSVENSMAERCRPHRHALEGWLGLPLETALSIPVFYWRIRLWFAARGLDPLVERELAWLGRVVERAWLPWVSAFWAGGSTLPEHGYHSLTHLLDVARLGARLAVKEAVNPIPAALFGLLHDAARVGDESGHAHAQAATILFDRMEMSLIRYLLLPSDSARLRVAIAGHADGKRSQDPLVGVCWDADRVRLAWERGVRPQFFSTRSGLDLALARPN